MNALALIGQEPPVDAPPIGTLGTLGAEQDMPAPRQPLRATVGLKKPQEDQGESLGDILSQTMTHQAEQPNPAKPYTDAAANFATGGLQRALGLPNNFVGEALQNPDNQAALGMGRMTTGFWPERGIDLVRKLSAEGKTIQEIADALGKPYGSVNRIKQIYDISAKGRQPGTMRSASSFESMLPESQQTEWETLPDGTLRRSAGQDIK